MSATPESVDVAVPRPSRQELVLPPRSSSWPVAAGVVASAAAGFGLVFFLGIGRGRPVDGPTDPGTTAVAATVTPAGAETVAVETTTAPPALLPQPQPTPQSPSDRWSSRGEAGRDAGNLAGDRYATRPASHDAAAPAELAAEQPSRMMSRFSSPDLPPAREPSPAASEPPTTDPPGAPPAEPDDSPASANSTSEPNSAADPATPLGEPIAASPPLDLPLTVSESTPAAIDSAPSATPLPVAAEPVAEQSPGQLPLPTDAPVADAPPEAEAEPIASDLPPIPPATAAPAKTADPEVPGFAVAAAPLPVAEPSPPAALDTVSPRAIDATSRPSPFPPSPTAVEPPPTAIPVGLPPPPFAAAPPIGPPRPLGTAATPNAGPGGPPALPVEASPVDLPDEPEAEQAIEGQGVPGPLQLEGVQTPQITVEKRGPKEIQVGQPARFEILVRNVGSATAHEVTLRDEVPRGTSLIATTPPAAPAEEDAKAELVWLLGTLPPAGEARVLMELMPEAEGEVGSVASVSFRADATLRTRATKPALTIDCPPPEPVRIGGDVEVTLTVSNTGSGTATGVVLEAFLPETVSHRAGPELEFDVGQLRPGESKTIDLVLGTRSPGRAPARFVARADGGIELDQPLPIPVTAPTLEVTIDMPARRFLQRPATCTISMVNAGTASARAVELAAQLPPGMKFVRANHAGWHDERSHRVLWNLEELPPGETGIVEVVVMPVQAGGQRITAAARSTDGPSDQALHVCQVEGLAALAFHVADSEDPIEVEGVTEYVIRVANEGTKAASGVRLAATLLGDLEPVEAEGPGRHRIENLAIEFEPLAKLGPGEEAIYKVRARGRRAGHQRVQVQLVSDDQPTPITKEEVTSVYDDR